MYQNRFTRILSIVIASQMALSPVAWSQATGAGTAGPQQSGGLENVAAILQGTNTVFTNITQAMQQQAATIAAQNQANALKAEMNPQNCGTVAQPVGCVSEIFPRCQILNTFPNLVEPSECTDGVDGSSPNAAAQAGVAAGYYAHFSLMENEYRLKGLESNNTSNVGMGCLNAHADRLQRQLKAREDEIDNLINKMQKKQDAYKIQAELERNKIEEAMALLEGSNFSSPRSAAILAQNTVRFDNIFKSNQACSAVLDADGFKRDGARGLKGIEASLLTIANRKETTGTSFSGLEFNQSHAERIEKDARRLASFVAREIQNRGTAALEGDFTAGLPSDYGLVGSPTLTTVLIEESKNSQLERDRIMREVQGSVDPNSQGLLTRIDDDTTDFEFELFNWERTQKNECLSRNANI